MNELSILIVSYNAADDLERCLDSLLDAPPNVSHEIVVIDNASTDRSVAVVKSRSRVRLIPLDSNVGFARANNIGFRNTQSHTVLLLNSDTIVAVGAIDRLLRQLNQLPGASVVGPRLVNASGAAELSFGRMMRPFSELRQKILNSPSLQRRVDRMTSVPRETDWVSGACLLVRRAEAESAGLLDERYFMYCEDVDFCAAIRARGGRVYFTPLVEVIHLRGRSRRAAGPATAAAYRASQLAFYRKHHPGWAPVLQLYLAVQGKLPKASADNP